MKFQGNPKDWGQGGTPPPPTSREATTPPSAPRPRRFQYPNIPRRAPRKPTLRPASVKHLQRLARLSQTQIDNLPETGDLMVPALELLAGLTPVGRGYLAARDVWGYFGPQQPEIPEVPAHWDYGAWEQYQECEHPGPGREMIYSTGNGSLVNPCIGGQGRNPRYDTFEEAAAGRDNVGLWQRSLTGVTFRYFHHRSWRKEPGAPALPYPEFKPYQPPVPGKRTVQPMPATVTPPVPATVQPMPQPRDTARPPSVIPGFVRPLPASPYRPSEVPANTIIVSPGGVSIPPQTPHVQAPAPGKEVKIKVQYGSPVYRAISNLYNGVTEASDFIDVVADAIEGNPCKGLNPVAKAWCVGRNIDRLDVDEMMHGLIYNYFEDQAVGAFLSWGKKSPYGVQTPTTGPSRRISPRPIR